MKRLLVFVKMHTLLSIVLAPVVVLLIMMVLGCPLLFIRGPFGPNRLTEGYMALFMVLILLVSFAISVLAPGNAVRAAREASISPVLAILLSLSNAVIWVMSWVNLPQIVLFAIAGVFSTACRIAASFRSSIRCWQVL